MCTVVFIPKKNRNVFASLRDESPLRPKAVAPVITKNELNILSPKDPLGGGTWIGANEFGNIIILLNGAFQKHKRAPQYEKSRGLIVSELLTSQVPVVDWSIQDLENIEPFTLIVWSDENLFKLVWDGVEKHRIRLDKSIPYLWSSATLYNGAAIQQREELFQKWIAIKPPVDQLSLLAFFTSFNDSNIGYLINRNEDVKTLSYSFIELTRRKKVIMDYYDLASRTNHKSELKIIANTDFYDAILKSSEGNS